VSRSAAVRALATTAPARGPSREDRLWEVLPSIAAAVVIFLLAFVPRSLDLDRHATA
jgi:hypothetical protein